MGVGADVAKWIKAVDCESTTRGFNPRRSPINKWTISFGDTRQSKPDGVTEITSRSELNSKSNHNNGKSRLDVVK